MLSPKGNRYVQDIIAYPVCWGRLFVCYLNKSSNVIVLVNTLEFLPGFKPNVVTSVGCIDDRLLMWSLIALTRPLMVIAYSAVTVNSSL